MTTPRPHSASTATVSMVASGRSATTCAGTSTCGPTCSGSTSVCSRYWSRSMSRASSMMWNSGCAKKRGMAERRVGERSTASRPSSAATSASTAWTDESIDEATFSPPPSPCPVVEGPGQGHRRAVGVAGADLEPGGNPAIVLSVHWLVMVMAGGAAACAEAGTARRVRASEAAPARVLSMGSRSAAGGRRVSPFLRRWTRHDGAPWRPPPPTPLRRAARPSPRGWTGTSTSPPADRPSRRSSAPARPRS